MHDIPRVGLYIKVDTRCRLNLYKAQLGLTLGRSVNQNEAIDHLLDQAGIPQVAKRGSSDALLLFDGMQEAAAQ